MGEYAEMMLDGTCCAQCGEYIGSDNGFPTLCGGCAAEESLTETRRERHTKRQCPHCGKLCKTPYGVRQHIAAKHPEAA